MLFSDEETGCYASYQCVLPMQVHGADYSQMGMINNAKAEKLVSFAFFSKVNLFQDKPELTFV